MYLPAANQLGFVTGGASRLSLTSTLATLTTPADMATAEPILSLTKPSANANFYGHQIKASTDILSSWLLNATSGETRFSAGYTGWGGFHTWYTNGTEKLRLSSSGLLTVTGSGELIRMTTTTARGSGSNYINFYDPTGQKGYIGYAGGADDILYFANILSSIQFFPAGVHSMSLFGNGRVAFKSIHNVGPVTGTTDQFISSGTYTPTVTNSANTSSLSGAGCQWTRVGNVVTVSGRALFSTTSASVYTALTISLPIASSLTGGSLAGTSARIDVSAFASNAGSIIAGAGVATLAFKNDAATGAGTGHAFTFTYEVN
jgi:hypothetical protein